MVREARQAITAIVAVLLVAAAHAQTAIKLATLVPQASVWDKNLKQMAEEWKEATGGRVTV
ncbi:MAG TPA: hypothetical protein VGX46_18400, partial [Vicinamibacterales bacterium]|nr:hypothetical protein [Vicinamibacterales bacterium]